MPTTDPEKQRQFALEAVQALRAGGYETYWAGGCVRDRLLGRAPKDYDVATNATPEQVRQVFGARRTYAVGAAFGVILVRGPRLAGEIEVATFRQDSTYSDGRHPDAVRFSTPREDALRRDFTINGFFYDPIAAEVIDFVGGQDDLQGRLVRAIGDPRQRFAEDKLRLVRAVRIAAAYDFALEPATEAAITEMAGDVTVVSPERIAAEIRLMLCGARPARAVELLARVGLLAVLLPEVGPQCAARSSAHCSGDPWPHTLATLERLVEPPWTTSMAALLHCYASRNHVEAIGRRWKLANREVERVRWLVAHYEALRAARQQPWSQLQPILIHEAIEELVTLHEADADASAADLADATYCRELLRRPAAELNPPPLLTGDDLIAHGVPRGRQYQWLLERLRAAQLDGQVADKRAALALVDQWLAERGPNGAQ